MARRSGPSSRLLSPSSEFSLRMDSRRELAIRLPSTVSPCSLCPSPPPSPPLSPLPLCPHSAPHSGRPPKPASRRGDPVDGHSLCMWCGVGCVLSNGQIRGRWNGYGSEEARDDEGEGGMRGGGEQIAKSRWHAAESRK
jgi:hypothetical protein